MKYQEIEGNLITLALEGKFDVIAHGVNCFCVQDAGLAPQMVQAFQTNKYDMEEPYSRGNINKLGQIEYNPVYIREDGTYFTDIEDCYENEGNLPMFYVVNAYTQFMYGINHADGVSKPLDYEALTLCMRKINHRFKGKHIGLPLIGCHLARGVWNYMNSDISDEEFEEFITGYRKDVKTIIQEELKDCDVTIVHFKPSPHIHGNETQGIIPIEQTTFQRTIK